MEFLKGKLVRTIELLGKTNGYLRNEVDIYEWCKNGEIFYWEASYLKKYNKELAE